MAIPGYTLDDRIAERVRATDYHDWRDRVLAIGGCAAPIRLFGAWQLQHHTTGTVLAHHGGDIFVPCGNRRASVCEACSDRYAADAFHLVRAGLSGGKGVPESVTTVPRVFATLTAPSFGPVHTRRTSLRGRVIPCRCREHHHDADPRIGGPLDSDTYDYTGAVLWQAHAGVLWQRFTMRLRRELAKAAGLRVRDFASHARLSYGKVAEYQRRGLIHFHAVIRVDGPDGPSDTPPSWVTGELLDQAIRAASAAVTVKTSRPDGAPLHLVWGEQVDIRTVTPATSAELEDERGEISESRLASYVAKYATKGTGKSEATDRPIRSQLDIEFLRVADHHRRIIQTCWDLGELAQYEKLNLRRWAHMLGFRGHFLTKSQRYSTTFKQVRGERRAWRLHHTITSLGHDPETVIAVNDWNHTGNGYNNDAERELAHGIAERTREHRYHKNRRENGNGQQADVH
jgi:hypothetical protein